MNRKEDVLEKAHCHCWSRSTSEMSLHWTRHLCEPWCWHTHAADKVRTGCFFSLLREKIHLVAPWNEALGTSPVVVAATRLTDCLACRETQEIKQKRREHFWHSSVCRFCVKWYLPELFNPWLFQLHLWVKMKFPNKWWRTIWIPPPGDLEYELRAYIYHDYTYIHIHRHTRTRTHIMLTMSQVLP